MGCACAGKGRTAAGATGPAGTYRVMVNGRKVYESTNQAAADAVAARFAEATILAPGQSA